MNKTLPLVLLLVIAIISSGVQAMQQDYKLQITSHRMKPYTVGATAKPGPRDEQLKPGKTINKINSKEVYITGQDAKYKLEFKDDGSTELMSLNGNVAIKIASLNSRNVIVLLAKDGTAQLKTQAVLVEEWIPGTGIGRYVGDIVVGDINI